MLVYLDKWPLNLLISLLCKKIKREIAILQGLIPYKKIIERENGMNWKMEIDMYPLLCTKQRTSENLL